MISFANGGRVVIGGASGFMGEYLTRAYRAAGREVLTIGRSHSDVAWGDDDGIVRAVDGAALVIGLAGKSVNCRYTAANRADIFRSRLDTTTALNRAIRRAAAPPPVWINSSTATIYRHAMDRPQTEWAGELGSGFSVDVAKAWEQALFNGELPHTRRVAMRTAIVLGNGGVFATLARLASVGLGGANWDGRWPVSHRRVAAGTAHYPGSRHGHQHFSWIHLDDVARAIEFIEQHPELDGAINFASPGPTTNVELMRAVRAAVGAKVGPPMPRWMSEMGAVMMRTETELILKSRWVLPEKLARAGFTFAHPDLTEAIASILPHTENSRSRANLAQ